MNMPVVSRGFLPLSWPGCPSPGPDFLKHALALSSGSDDDAVGSDGAGGGTGKKRIRREPPIEVVEELYRRATYDGTFTLVVNLRQETVVAGCVVGHLWGGDGGTGPVGASVMVVGLWPGDREVQLGRNLAGPSGEVLGDVLAGLGCDWELAKDFYVTNLVKHPKVDPSATRVPAAWIRNWRPVLFQELAWVRPSRILCLGAEAAEAILDRKVAVKDAQGLVFTRLLPGTPWHTPQEVKVHVVLHPANVARDPTQKSFLVDGLRPFVAALLGKDDSSCAQASADLRTCWYEDELAIIVDEVLARSGSSPLIVFDSEWHGLHPSEPGAYLRTVQFSDRGDFACCVVLRAAGGAPAFAPSPESAIPHLERLLTPTVDRVPRVCGHHLRADIPWVRRHLGERLGRLLSDGHRPAAYPELVRSQGGIDTMLAVHAIRETGFFEGFKLESVCQSLLGVEKWNGRLERWKKLYCAEHGIKVKDLLGYGDVPDEILHPYALGDVLYPRRLLDLLLAEGGLLDRDEYGNDSWRPLWTSMRSVHAFLEMEETGLYVDRAVAAELTQLFEQATAAQLEWLRREANWPDFNPNSGPDCRELLFGEEYAKRKSPGPCRPVDAISLRLTPVRTTGSPPKDWDKVQPSERGLYTPSTDKEVLGILRDAHPLVNGLRNYRFLAQMVKMTLRPPVAGDLDDNGELVDGSSESGDSEYDGGLMSFVRHDGRIYTRMYPTTETGRVRSSSPNCQNLASRREDDYKKILGDAYRYPVRAVFAATPPVPGEEDDPWLLVSFDLTGAELFVMAVQSQDQVMIEQCRRSNLPEGHPDHLDLHAQTAVDAFGLSCSPTKEGLKSVGAKNLRVAAKTLRFGIPYGRGDDAVVRAIKEEGVDATSEQVARLRRTIMETNPMLGPFFTACQERVVSPGWMRNCFGRLRRFPRHGGREALAKMAREAGPFAIQGAVADVVHLWMHAIESLPDRLDDRGRPRFRLLLQIHDALMAEVRVSSLKWFCREAVRGTLARIPIHACDLDGNRRPNVPPYYMGVDVSIHRHWGVDLPSDELVTLGVPPDWDER